jgi:hypothetical protein
MASFTSLKEISTPDEYPYSAVVKLFMTYDEHDNNKEVCDDSTEVCRDCSGILIDPFHVLTAGHCAYLEPESPGDPVSGWLETIKVVPGYEERDYVDKPNPYGHAFNVPGRESVFVGWIDRFDDRDDMAIIELDRPIGALAGYLSYAAVTDPYYFLTKTFYTRGYPGEGDYDGRLMYEMRGTFDGGEFSCNTNFFAGVTSCDWWTQYGTVYDEGQRLYKVFSGSGVYFITSTGGIKKRFVTAVASTYISNFDRSVYTIITGAKFNEINRMIEERTPSSTDLITLNVIAEPKEISQGDQTSISFKVHNYSSQSWPEEQPIRGQLYLSQDPIISSYSDIPLVTVLMLLSMGVLLQNRQR